MLSGRIDGRKLLARGLIITGLAMIAYYYGTNAYTAVEQNKLRRAWSIKKSSGEVKKTGGTEAGNAAKNSRPIFGRLRIPKMGLDVIVLRGTDPVTLRSGPGHIKGTANPEAGKNTAISGHRTTFGAPFARLDRLRNGDLIYLETDQGAFTYTVTGRASVRPIDITVIGQNFTNRLTLTTCDPPGTAVRRLAVWGQKR